MATDFGERIGKRLKELRGEKSQADIVKDILDKTGIAITAQTLGRYENGSRLPDIQVFEAIARTYDVSADYLLLRTDVRKKDGDLRGAADYTGLSEKAAEILHVKSITSPRFPKLISEIIESPFGAALNECIIEIEQAEGCPDRCDLARYKAQKYFLKIMTPGVIK